MSKTKTQKENLKAKEKPIKEKKKNPLSEAIVNALTEDKVETDIINDKKLARLLGLNTKKENKYTKFLNSFFARFNKDSNKDKKLKKTSDGLISKLKSKLFDSNDKQVEKLKNFAKDVVALEKKVSKMSDEKLKSEVQALKSEFQKALNPDTKILMEKGRAWLETKQGSEVLNFIIEKLPLCFALVREAANRAAKHKHYEVQLMAGIALTQGRIIEFKTGEGKTLVAPLALFVYALFGRGSYLVTVNDYLARRDGEWVGRIMSYLGLSVGIINQDKSYKYISPELLSEYGKSKQDIDLAKKIDWTRYSSLKGLTLVETSRKDAYECDITYGTNSEFGFDYLRDNMQKNFENMNQRLPFFCVIDEVDSILIDEARTPLIISDSAEESNILYQKFAKLVKDLEPGDYTVDEKERAVTLTPTGISKMEKWLGIDNIWTNNQYAKYLDRSLLAAFYYKRDDQYIVNNGEVVLVDEFTGRLQQGRRLSDGIHQAIEAKEGVAIQRESRTMATVTYQNYFRLYPVMSGMTGTALTESEEFGKIYNLDVVEIPTHREMIRIDHQDVIYKNEDSKFRAIAKDIEEKHKKGQPVLVGTVSVDKSEKLSALLKRAGIKHEVLNAKNHSREADIIAKAGEKGSVTISTNMAGRGTDIKLGKGVAELGGLYVIGTERHESRRIDNQLRGRSGRQGDPGESRFYLALDDEIMRIYGGDLIKKILNAANTPDDIPFESRFITRTIKSAQRRVEAENFDIRKHLVDYDDVLNKQRLVIYNRRRRIIELFNEAKAYYEINKSKIDKQISGSGIPVDEIRLRDYVNRKLRQRVEFFINDASNDEILKKDQIELALNELLKIMPKDILEYVIREELDTNYEKFVDFLMTNPTKERLREQFTLIVDEAYDYKEKIEGFVTMREIEKYVMLEAIDTHWVDHLENMEDLRSGVTLQGYGQKDPLHLYQNEGYAMFVNLIATIDADISSRIMLYTARVERQAKREESLASAKSAARMAQEALEKAFADSQKKKKK
jgi:preprotein translocase subunit SecA